MQMKRILKNTAITLAAIVLLIIAVNIYYLPQTVSFSAMMTAEDGRGVPVEAELTCRRFLDAEPEYSGWMRVDGETVTLNGFSAEQRDFGSVLIFMKQDSERPVSQASLFLDVYLLKDEYIPTEDLLLPSGSYAFLQEDTETCVLGVDREEWLKVYKKVAKLCR